MKQRLDDSVRRLKDSPIAGSNLKQSTKLRMLAESHDEVRQGAKVRKYGDPTGHVTEYYSEVLMRRRSDGLFVKSSVTAKTGRGVRKIIA